jgi:flagellar motor switch protein FliG
MSQASVTNVDKAAVLLSRLDPQALDTVLEMLGPEFAGRLRPVLAAVPRRKDLLSLSDQVLQEFRELQQDVRAAVSGSPALQQGLQSLPETAAHSSAVPKSARGSGTPALPDEIMHRNSPDAASGSTAGTDFGGASDAADVDSLAAMPPSVLAAALKRESPRIIATVLKQLPSEISGKVLEALPPDQRQGLFVLMADSTRVNPEVVRRVLQGLTTVCKTVDPEVVQQQDQRVKSLIGILQAVEREERIRLLETLTEHDPELAAQIDTLMYDYTDILRIEDRSVQKLLAQLEQKVVAVALKAAPEELRQKVFKNLSERVRLALHEEMELSSGITAAKADQARREIANVIRSQDKDGSLAWIE